MKVKTWQLYYKSQKSLGKIFMKHWIFDVFQKLSVPESNIAFFKKKNPTELNTSYF